MLNQLEVINSKSDVIKQSKPSLIKSYLIFSKPKTQELTQQKTELTLSESVEPSREPSPVSVDNPKQFSSSVEQTPTETSVSQEHQNNTLNEDTNSDNVNSTLLTPQQAVKQLMQQQNSGSYTQWLQQNQPRITTQKQSTIGKPLFSKGSGIKGFSVSADGSRVIKVGESCFSVSINEYQESLWLSTGCPRSADANRQQLRQSLNKFSPENKQVKW